MPFLQKYFFPIILFCLAFSTAFSQILQSGGQVDGPEINANKIADEVMEAQGGLENWHNTRVIAWNFFSSRDLIWDKWTGDVRIDFKKRDLKIILNLNSGKGRVWLNGAETTQPDSLAKYLDRGKKVWINDSYWLVMPFKLRDPGVKLKALGDDKTVAGSNADLLQLTFENVGVTPENKYHIWVDKTTRLVTQWAFFAKNTDEKHQFISEWTDYKTYGKIKLSGDRGGDGGKLTPIHVLNTPPKGAFDNFEKVVFD